MIISPQLLFVKQTFVHLVIRLFTFCAIDENNYIVTALNYFCFQFHNIPSCLYHITLEDIQFTFLISFLHGSFEIQ